MRETTNELSEAGTTQFAISHAKKRRNIKKKQRAKREDKRDLGIPGNREKR